MYTRKANYLTSKTFFPLLINSDNVITTQIHLTMYNHLKNYLSMVKKFLQPFA